MNWIEIELGVHGIELTGEEKTVWNYDNTYTFLMYKKLQQRGKRQLKIWSTHTILLLVIYNNIVQRTTDVTINWKFFEIKVKL